MEHIAIMKKSWGLVPKILTGKKKIESRWYKVKYPPWDRIERGETVYFKDSGEPVTVKAEVDEVIQISGLDSTKVREILDNYGKSDGLGIEDIPKFYEMFKDKKYCIIIFLKDPQNIKPFDIDKKGFGAMSSWLIVDDVNKIKI
jgi:ASC-1-like (ASCH) protein